MKTVMKWACMGLGGLLCLANPARADMVAPYVQTPSAFAFIAPTVTAHPSVRVLTTSRAWGGTIVVLMYVTELDAQGTPLRSQRLRRQAPVSTAQPSFPGDDIFGIVFDFSVPLDPNTAKVVVDLRSAQIADNGRILKAADSVGNRIDVSGFSELLGALMLR